MTLLTTLRSGSGGPATITRSVALSAASTITVWTPAATTTVVGETRPNTELTVILTDAHGVTTTLDSNAADPRDRPRGISFSTQLGSGFTTGEYNLRRRIDRENADHALLDHAKFIGANGETAFEGYVDALPRSMDAQTHTLSVRLAGWIASAQDEPCSEMFVDRRLSEWRGAGTNRRANLLSASYGQVTDPSTSPDASGRQTLRTAWTGAWTAGSQPTSEAWYDAGPGNTIGRITADWTKGAGVNHADGNYAWRMLLATDDTGVAYDTTANLLAAGPGTGASLPATTSDRRYGLLQLLYLTAAGGTAGDEYGIDWSNVAVYGNQGVPLLGAAAPYGVAASDVIRYLAARYCPMLDTSGVQDTTYPIAQLVFSWTKPYDAFLHVNQFHLWDIGVYEDRVLHFKPIDMSDWDWEIRSDEVGREIGLQGDEATQLRNGLIVEYTNVATGQVDVLQPEDYAELRDDSLDNPYNQHGRKGYGPEPFVIPFPTTTANALELGRIKLAEDNQIKAPGQFTVRNHIRDRAGNLRPAWAIRAGDRIRLTSSVNLSDRPRLVWETSYDHASRAVTVTVDSTARFLDAYVDRVLSALAANNLG